MEDFICILLTSRNCGHCNHFRGNGLVGNGNQLMEHSYIKSIAKHCIFLNIHYKDMSGKNNLIDSVSKFTLGGKNNVVQEIYAFKEEDAIVSIVVHDGKKIQKVTADEIKSGDKKVSWKTFVEKKIPLKMSNYTYFYPCFLFVSKKSWLEGLEGKEFYAIANAGITRKFPNGTIGLEKSSQSINSRNVKPEKLLKDLIDKNIDLNLYLSKDKKTSEESATEDNTGHDLFVLKSFDED